jgi:glycosyltransferase involved in cell wall biosynthesis
MKICHVTSVHNFNDNRIFYKEIKSIHNAGFDVCLIAPGDKDFEFEGVKIYHLKRSAGRISRMLRMSIVGVLKRSKEIKADVYHLHDPELMIVGLILRLKGKKVVFDVHENNPASILSKPYIKYKFQKLVLSKVMMLMEKFFFTFFTKIVTARPDISESLSRFKPITLRNVPILPTLDKIEKPNFIKDKFALIFVGGITSIRGVKELIQAVDKVNDCELWLLGPFEDSAIENECKSLKGWSKVRYLGVVEPFEIFKYISYADVGVVTFLPLPNHLKTLATKPFEYMACGKPMIMSDFPYWREFFKDSSLYVDPQNIEQIAQTILQLKNDHQLLISMGQLNKELAYKEYSWNSEVMVLIDFYNQMAKQF